MHPNETPATYEQIHRALLAGLLGNVGIEERRRRRSIIGARGIQFADLSRARGCARRSRTG